MPVDFFPVSTRKLYPLSVNRNAVLTMTVKWMPQEEPETKINNYKIIVIIFEASQTKPNGTKLYRIFSRWVFWFPADGCDVPWKDVAFCTQLWPESWAVSHFRKSIRWRWSASQKISPNSWETKPFLCTRNLWSPTAMVLCDWHGC